jgi:hypothetical protein
MTWLCGECGISTEQLREHTMFKCTSDRILMANHVWNAHDVTQFDLAHIRHVGDTWLLPDGRVFMRQASA